MKQDSTSVNSQASNLDDYDEPLDKYATLIAISNYKDPF